MKRFVSFVVLVCFLVNNPVFCEETLEIFDKEISEARIIPEDILAIQYENQKLVIAVDRNGAADIPGLGEIKVAGMKPVELEDSIYERTSKNCSVIIASLPQGLQAYKIPQGVNVIGEVNRPGLVNPGRITSIASQSMGTTDAFSGRTIIFRRDRHYVIKFNKILKGKYKNDLLCRDGDTVYFEKSSGAKFIDGVKPWIGTLRDIALVVIAVSEVNDLGEKQNWW